MSKQSNYFKKKRSIVLDNFESSLQILKNSGLVHKFQTFIDQHRKYSN
jgi:hypothetical protein